MHRSGRLSGTLTISMRRLLRTADSPPQRGHTHAMRMLANADVQVLAYIIVGHSAGLSAKSRLTARFAKITVMARVLAAYVRGPRPAGALRFSPRTSVLLCRRSSSLDNQAP